MSLATLNPWQVLDQIQKEAFATARANNEARRWHPATDIVELEAAYNVVLDLPGVADEDVSIEVNEQKLYISGKRARADSDIEKAHHNERVFGEFKRAFHLPKDADEAGIKAQFTQGVLSVTIPKHSPQQPRKIEINH